MLNNSKLNDDVIGAVNAAGASASEKQFRFEQPETRHTYEANLDSYLALINNENDKTKKEALNTEMKRYQEKYGQSFTY